jgi:hypothetical protein
VAFLSVATNLVQGDTNEKSDAFVRDLATGRTSRLNGSSAGKQANAGVPSSYPPQISGDGESVAFTSSASNLIAGDTNAASDVFVRDRVKNTTARVSVTSSGKQANGNSWQPDISSDGHRISFISQAPNMHPSAKPKFLEGMFIRDRTMRKMLLVAYTSTPVTYPYTDLSADGRVFSYDIEEDSPTAFHYAQINRFVVKSQKFQALQDPENTGPYGGYLGVATESLAATTAYDGGDGGVKLCLYDWANDVRTQCLPVLADNPAISNDAGAVVFTTELALVSGDTNGVSDVVCMDSECRECQPDLRYHLTLAISGHARRRLSM